MRPVLLVALLVAGCGRNGGAVDAAPPLQPTGAVDVLFLVDNSATSIELQVELAEKIGVMTARLAERSGGELPDLHLAVVSGDLGARGSEGIGCDGDGDEGRFQATRGNGSPAGCPLPGGLWIEDRSDGAGGRISNLTGSLEETFGCIVRLGSGGCGFQQHQRALQWALDGRHPEHDGFLRADAVLAVVIVADDDDCSSTDPRLYGPETEEFGPVSSYRCAEHGWLCNGEPLPPGAGTYDDCEPRIDSVIIDPQLTVDLLAGLKSDLRRLVLAGILAPDSPVVVYLNDVSGARQLQNICPTLNHSTNIRDRAVVDTLGGIWVDNCDEDLAPGLEAIADRVADRMAGISP